MLKQNVFKGLVLTAFLAFLSACNSGGKMTLEPGAVINKKKGSPFVQVNQGGRASIVEQGKTASTGVHGWVAVQSVSSKTLSDNVNNRLVINKAGGSQ